MQPLTPPPKKTDPSFDSWVSKDLYERLKTIDRRLDPTVFPLTAGQARELVGGDSTPLHFHEEDRNRANHTGTQPASTITGLEAAMQSIVASAGSIDHATLLDLAWTISGHTGTASTVAGFDSSGAAEYLTRSGTGTVVVLQASPTITGTLTADILTATGNATLGNASADTLNVGSGDLQKDALGNTGLGIAPSVQNTGSRLLHIHGGANGSEVRLTNTATGSAAGNGSIFEIVGSDAYLYNFENASLILGTNSADRLTISGTGAATFAQTLGVTGDFAVNTNKFTVAASSGNTLVAGTLNVTGAATLSSTLAVTGDFAVNTNKFTVAASSGNTVVAGTLNVTGAATFGSASFGAATFTDITSTGNTILGNASGDTLNVGNGDIQKDASGNVGFGVAAVRQNANARTLHIDGGANGAELRFTNNATGSAANNGSILEIVGSDTYLYNFEAAKLYLGTNATEAVQIDSSQNVGIGMTPGRKLDVTGTFGATGAATLGSTLAVTGDFAVNTNKFTVAASSGNTLVAGTFNVTGAATLSSTLGVTGAVTLSSTCDVTGAVTGSSFTDSKGEVRTIPQNSKSAAYTTVLSDAGKHIFHPSADTTARTWTIDSNANVAYPVGTAITFVNQNSAGVITISITSDTMRMASSGATGSRTLAANGIATALKVTTTEWIISGTGLS